MKTKKFTAHLFHSRHIRGWGFLVLIVALSVFPIMQIGAKWTPMLPPTNPGGRSGHSMAQFVDGRIIVFGGKDAANLFNDIYMFQEQNWSKVTPAGTPPSPRYGHSMVTISDDQAIVFGGTDAAGEVLNDLHLYDSTNNTWSPIAPSGTFTVAARTYHAAAVTESGEMVVIGGEDAGGVRKKDAWRYNPQTNVWVQGADAPRTFSRFGIAVVGDKVHVLAQSDNTVYTYDAAKNEWSETSFPAGEYGPLREFPAVAQFGETAWLFGGTDWRGDPYAETWEIDLQNFKWIQQEAMPEALAKARAAALTALTEGDAVGIETMKAGDAVQIIVFGGERSDDSFSDSTYLYTPPLQSSITITKYVSPEGQVQYGDELTYTLVISGAPGAEISMYDPLTSTTFARFLAQPDGIEYASHAITGTMVITPTNSVTVSFIVQVGVPGTIGIYVDVNNTACIYPVGQTISMCEWSNTVTNQAYRPYTIFLPLVMRNQ